MRCKNKNFAAVKLLFSVAFLFMVCTSLPAFAFDKITLGYVGFSTDKPFWSALGGSIAKHCAERGASLLDFTPVEPDAEAQVRLLALAIEKKVDALIVGANNPPLLYDVLDDARDAGIPVIAVDTRLDHPSIAAFVATDNQQGAVLAGRYIVEKTGGKGSVLILGGSKGHPNGEARRDGVTAEALKAGMTVIFSYADWDDEKAFKIAASELRKDNDISAIFSCWDPGIQVASHVVSNMGLQDKLVLVGFDGLPNTLSYIRNGQVTATVAQDTEAMGRHSVESALKVLAGLEGARESLIAPYVIDKEVLGK